MNILFSGTHHHICRAYREYYILPVKTWASEITTVSTYTQVRVQKRQACATVSRLLPLLEPHGLQVRQTMSQQRVHAVSSLPDPRDSQEHTTIG